MKRAILLPLALLYVQCQAAEPPAGSREAYLKNGCWQCHGTVGQGSLVGPRLDPSNMPVEVFSALVRNPARAMPPYGEAVLADAELRLIYGYLQNVPPSPKAADVQLLKP
jgi:ubiquinol-cytochrome c reductase cytochrome c subunit